MGQLNEVDLKSLNKYHLLLLAILMIFGAVFYFFIQARGEMVYDYKSSFFITTSIFSLVGILMGTKIYKTNINKAPSRAFANYNDAMLNFRSANIAKWIAIFLPALVALLFANTDDNPMIFFPAIIGLLFLFVSKVKPEHFANYKYKKE